MKQIDTLKSEVRPWGSFTIIKENKSFKIKKIEIQPGMRLSYQFHKKRSETWVIIEGEGEIWLDDKIISYKKGDTIIIPRTMKHRISNQGKTKTVLIEIQTGEYFGEDDIVRIEDDFNR